MAKGKKTLCTEAADVRPGSNVALLPCRTQMNLARQWHDDSTAAVSNVEPNTVAPNSKDKTNHPSSGNGYFPAKVSKKRIYKASKQRYPIISSCNRHQSRVFFLVQFLYLIIESVKDRKSTSSKARSERKLWAK